MLLGFIISVIFIWILKSTESSLIKKIKNASTEGEIKYLRSKLIKERIHRISLYYGEYHRGYLPKDFFSLNFSM